MLSHGGFGVLIVVEVVLYFVLLVVGCVASAEALSRTKCTPAKLHAAWIGVVLGGLFAAQFVDSGELREWGWQVLLITAPLLMNALALSCHYWPWRSPPKQQRRR